MKKNQEKERREQESFFILDLAASEFMVAMVRNGLVPKHKEHTVRFFFILVSVAFLSHMQREK